MLLLTTLTVGGREGVEIFEFLPGDTGDRLRDKADKLLEISAEKRIPFMVKEIKANLNHGALQSGLEQLDPSWLVHELHGESPAIVGCVLLDLPKPTVKSILKRLPDEIRQQRPPKKNLRNIPAEAIQHIRYSFFSRFTPIPSRGTNKSIGFQDLLFMSRADLLTLLQGLGMAELGQAFVSVGPLALKELCRRLSKDKQAELISATKLASSTDGSHEFSSAQRFLARNQINFEDPNKFFHKAGLWRLAKSALHESPTFHSQLAQKLPRGPGLIFLEYITKMKEMEDLTPELTQRFQDSVLLKLQLLATEGQLSEEWGSREL